MITKAAGGALRMSDFDLEDLEVKAAADGQGYSLTGYGSVFGVKDSYGEVVVAGAFKASIAEIKAKGRKLPMLWQHRSAEPIGVWESMREDEKGLRLEGTILKGVQVAEEAYIRAKAGAVSGLSIGYYVRDSSPDEKTRIVSLKKLDLIETSLVTFPANDDARVDAVKFMLAEGQLPSVKEFERFLRREAGLSRTAASLVMTRGYAELFRRESEGGADEPQSLPSPVAAALKEARAALANRSKA